MSSDGAGLTLTQRSGRAVGFRLGGNMASILLGLGLGIILARILPPAEFGVFGVGLGIVTVADIIGSAGMFQALIQRKDLRPEDETTGFLLQLTGSLVLGGILVLSGPYLAAFFKMPGLAPLIQLQAAVLVLHAVNLVPATRLNRRLAFDRLALMDIAGRVAGGIVAIVLALQGHGALALTAGSLSTAATRTALGWTFAWGGIPFHFSFASARALLGFGTGILFIRICNDFSHRVDVFIIGRRLGAGVVGLYQRAYQLMTIPLFQFTNAINQVLFPAMSKVQSDDERFRKGYLGSVGLSSMVAFPLLTLLWTCGDVLIPFLYGPRWEGTVPLLVALSFVGYLRVVNNPNGLVTQSRARVMAEAWRQAAFSAATALFVLVGSFWGIQGAVAGVGAATFVYLFAMTRLALRIADVPLRSWLGALRTTLFSTALMALVVLAVKEMLKRFLPDFLLLAALTLVGFLIFLAAVAVFMSVNEREILRSVGKVLPRRFSWIVRLVVADPPGKENHAEKALEEPADPQALSSKGQNA
jgi:polysaccharide transporter, PST family